jgi:hypothetical protein
MSTKGGEIEDAQELSRKVETAIPAARQIAAFSRATTIMCAHRKRKGETELYPAVMKSKIDNRE